MPKINTHTLVKVAILSALSVVLMMLEIPLPFAPAFYKLDFSEVPVLLGAFSLGPGAAVLIELLKNLLYLLLRGTATAGVGELANFAVGLAFVLPAALLYRRRRSRRQAVIGLAAGTVCITLAGALVNYFVLLPAYSAFMGLPLDSLIQMGTAVNRHITSLGTLVVFATAPFNLVKGLFCSLIVLLIYKKLSPLLHR